MKLAVISDIHGHLVALEAALKDLESTGDVDVIWILGDLAAMGPRPAECIQRVRDLIEAHGKDKVKVIGGNTDRYIVTGERFKTSGVADETAFKQLPASRRAFDAGLHWCLECITWEDYEFLKGILGREAYLNVPGYGPVIGYHAIPGDDEAFLKPETPDEEAADALLDREGTLGIGGHTHIQMDRFVPGWRMVNVGSVGLSADMPGKAQWGLFTFEDGAVTVELRAAAYNVQAAIDDMTAVSFPAADNIAQRLQPTAEA